MRDRRRPDGAHRRVPARVLLALGLLLGGVTPAKASVFWTGVCALELTFTFGSRVRSAPAQTAPGYSIAVSQAADLNPDTTSTEACAVSLPNRFRSTTAGGGGWSVSWTCESTLGLGTWNQGWSPLLPAVFDADLRIAGTWGHWTMEVNSSSLEFAAVFELTVHPDDASKLTECETGGITSLKMLGTEVFQDPQIPGEA